MRRATLLSISLFAVLATAHTADAGYYEFWQRVHLDFHRVNAYPEPFVQADRMAVRAPFATMVNNGWRAQNTLSHHHFDVETQELTQAGALKLRWILTQAPEQRRTIFVLNGIRQEATSVRIDSVQQHASRMIPGQLPPVLATGVEPHGWPASEIDQTLRKRDASIPAPVLPAVDTESSSN